MVGTSFYDVVVCGHEFGALLTSALLARRGFRVLLLGHDAHPLSIDLGGFVLARGPGCLPALDSPALGRVLNDLSLVQVLRRRIVATKADFEVCLGDRRFALSGDDARLNHQIDAWWPEESAEIRASVTRLGATEGRVAQVLATGKVPCTQQRRSMPDAICPGGAAQPPDSAPAPHGRRMRPMPQ